MGLVQYNFCMNCVKCVHINLFSLFLPLQNWYDHQFICVQIVDFLKKKEFVKSSLQHIGTSAITDLVLRLITCMENGDIRTGILEVIKGFFRERPLMTCDDS